MESALARPTDREGFALNDPSITSFTEAKAADDLAGSVFGVIVEHDAFVVWIVLREEGSDTGLNVASLIPCRDQNGDERGFIPRRRKRGPQAAETADIDQNRGQRHQESGKDQQVVEDEEGEHGRTGGREKCQ